MHWVPSAIALLVAFALDRAFGEPPTRWHPVGWIGRYFGWTGGLIGRQESRPQSRWLQFCSGALAWWGGALLVLGAALLLERASHALGAVPGAVLAGAALKPMLSWRMLRDEVQGVEQGLGQSVDAGRSRLQRLVSRDVTTLDDAQVREGALESLAENLNDSVVAPVFWFVLAGLPGAMIYRFANTADAMWGYRGVRAGMDWTWAGKWAARTDDVLSWVPARLTALLLGVAAGGVRFRALCGEARHTPSPNGGWPMAAMALALGVCLRKPGVYELNAGAVAPQPRHTAAALTLASRSVALLVTWAVAALLGMAWLQVQR